MSDERTHQLSLFDLGECPAVEKKPSPSRWYYVTRRRNAEMLHYIAKDGTHVWTEHDPRNTTPHLFSSAVSARRVALAHKGEYRRWYFRVKNRPAK